MSNIIKFPSVAVRERRRADVVRAVELRAQHNDRVRREAHKRRMLAHLDQQACMRAQYGPPFPHTDRYADGTVAVRDMVDGYGTVTKLTLPDGSMIERLPDDYEHGQLGQDHPYTFKLTRAARGKRTGRKLPPIFF